MKYLAILTALTALSGAQPALAQVTSSPIGAASPLGITSPLGIGPAAQVSPIGVPMGATQLGTSGISPALSGSVPLSAMTGSNTACGGSASMTSGISDPAALFDAGMSAGSASGTCTATGGASNPAASASSPTSMGALAAAGRVGIPIGSTELLPGGLSPAPSTASMATSPSMTTSSASMMTSPSTMTVGPPTITFSPSTLMATSPYSSSTASSSVGGQTSSALTLPNGLPAACAGVPGNINSINASRGPC